MSGSGKPRVLMFNKVICKNMLTKGICNFDNCVEFHPPLFTSNKTFYGSVKVYDGDEFICKNFARGYCKNGNTCHEYHPYYMTIGYPINVDKYEQERTDYDRYQEYLKTTPKGHDHMEMKEFLETINNPQKKIKKLSPNIIQRPPICKYWVAFDECDFHKENKCNFFHPSKYSLEMTFGRKEFINKIIQKYYK